MKDDGDKGQPGRKSESKIQTNSKLETAITLLGWSLSRERVADHAQLKHEGGRETGSTGSTLWKGDGRRRAGGRARTR